MSAFYFGETLQANTTLLFSASYKNNSFSLRVADILKSGSPPTIIALFLMPYSIEPSYSFLASIN